MNSPPPAARWCSTTSWAAVTPTGQTTPHCGTVELFVEELQTLRHALALDSVHLFGLSWGGMLALEYALTQPDGLLSMTLMGTLADVPLYAEEAKRLREGLPSYTRQTMARMEARWRPPPEQGSGKLRAGRTPRQMRRDAHIMRGFIPLLAARPVQRVAAIASAVPGLEVTRRNESLRD